MPIFYLIVSFTLNAITHSIFKMASLKGLQWPGWNPFNIIIQNYLLVLAVLSLGISAIAYFLTLRIVSLSVAYPIIVSMTLILVNFSSYFYFHEKITLLQGIGYVFIITGITFVFAFMPKAATLGNL